MCVTPSVCHKCISYQVYVTSVCHTKCISHQVYVTPVQVYGGSYQWVCVTPRVPSRLLNTRPAAIRTETRIFESKNIMQLKVLAFAKTDTAIEGASNYGDPSPWLLTWLPLPPSLPMAAHAPLRLRLSLSLAHASHIPPYTRASFVSP